MTAQIIPFVKESPLRKCSFCGEKAKTIENKNNGKCICYKCVAVARKRVEESV